VPNDSLLSRGQRRMLRGKGVPRLYPRAPRALHGLPRRGLEHGSGPSVTRGDSVRQTHKLPTTAAISAIVLVLVTILVGAAGIIGLNTMQRGLDEITAARVPALTSLYITEHHLDAADQATIKALFGYSPENRRQAAELTNGERVSAWHSFQQYLSYASADERTQAEAPSTKAQHRFAIWMSANQQITQLERTGIQLPDSKAYPARDLEQQSVFVLQQAITPLIQINQDAIQAADARGADSHNKAVAELFVVMAITIFGAIVL